VLADPERYLQGAATFTHYELDSWTAAARPPAAVMLVREGLRHDGAGGGAPNSRIQVTIVHYDGFRRALQSKVQVEPGSALQRDPGGSLVLDAAGVPVEMPAAERWLVGGHTLYNAKQQPVRSYEPFYSPTPAFEPEEALRHYGVASESTYDAVGRVVREDLPHGCFRTFDHLAWEGLYADENDNVRGSLYEAVRRNLPDADPERRALAKADAHAGTITSVDLDGAGQVVRWRQSTGAAPRVWQVRLDHHGKPVEATDARGLTAYTRVYDMLGRLVSTTSIDAGESVSLPDAQDRVVDEWNSTGLHVHSTYDTLDRLTRCDADGRPDVAGVVEQRIYGDDPGVAQAAERNARGRLVTLRDSAGTMDVPRFDPAGCAMETERRLCSDYQRVPDWTNAAAVALDPEVYLTAARRDALGRTLLETLPDAATRTFEYARGGFLRRVRISSADGLLNDTLADGIEYNARGQRVRSTLGNRVGVESRFDGETYRPVRVTATRPAQGAQPPAVLQDLTYTYDPAGNIVRCLDAPQEPAGASPAFLTGINVTSACEYTYDPLYQLTQASGRVHQALLEHDWMAGKGTRHLHLNNGAAVERYTRTYTYDISGNLTRIDHRGQSNQWVTDMWVSAASNRALPARNLAGIPLANPEARFDRAGNCRYLPHIPTLDWNWQNGISRAVIVDRSAAGQPDDAEYYVYDGDGQRVRKVLERLVAAGQVERTETIYFEGGEIRRIRRGAQLLVERLTSDVRAAGLRALIQRWHADVLNRETANVAEARFRYVLASPTGSSLLELDGVGRVITYEEYFPFGGTAFLAGDKDREVESKDYRYSGKERDDITGLYYFGYRYFAPYIGRWMSPDPAGTNESLNLYEYARNNPISRLDADGRKSQPATQGDYRRIPVEQVPEQFRAPYSRLSNEQLRQFNRNQANFYQSPDGKIEFLPLRQVQKRVKADLARGKTVNDLRLEPKSNQKPSGDGAGKQQAPDLSAGGAKDGAKDGGDGGKYKTGGGDQLGSGGDADEAGGGLKGPGGNGEEKNNDRNLGLGNTGTGPGGGGQAEAKASGTEAGEDTGTGTGAEGGDAGADQEDNQGEDEEGQDEISQKGKKDADPSGAGEQDSPGNIPPSEGLLPAPADLKVNGNDPNGAPDGSRGSARETSRTGTGRPGNGARHPGGSGPGDDPKGQQQTFWDKAAHLAGYLNFEFGAGDREHGASGGVPGGGGSLNLGAVGQALYVVATVISTIVTVGEIIAAIKLVVKIGLRAALRLALTRIKESIAALRGALREAASLLKQGFRGLRSRIASLFQAGRNGVKRKFFDWLGFGDKGGSTGYKSRTGPWWKPVYNGITKTIDDAKGTWGWIDTNAHENIHVFVYKHLPRLARLMEVEVFGAPVFAPLAWLEETAAYSWGHARAYRILVLPLAPIEAFLGVHPKELAVNTVYLLAGAGYAAYRFISGNDKSDNKEPKSP
jgi:RHS repeat-associated protein